MLVIALKAYYVVGPALVVWAVIIAVIGIRRPEFPRKIGAERIVIAVTALLMLATILSSTIGAETEKAHEPKTGSDAHTGRGETQTAPGEPEK